MFLFKRKENLMKKLKKLLLILLFSIIALDICFIGFIIKDISIDFTSNNISEIEKIIKRFKR